MEWEGMRAALGRRTSSPAFERIPYGPGPHHFGELALPTGRGPFPVAVVLHGGCWKSLADAAYMRPLCEALHALGWATWNLEFRRIDQPGGGWPGILEDVARGADRVRDLAGRYPVDPGCAVAVGHSSGGHLALWLAARRRLPPDRPGGARLRGEDPLPLAGVAGLAAIADLGHFRRYTRCGTGVVEALLGGSLDRDRLRVTDPSASLPLGTPQWLVSGTLDPVVPPAHAEAYVRRARAAGDEVRWLTVPDAGHFELVAPWTAPWPAVERTLAGLLASGAGGRAP
ncbi:MAG: alpha/beta hydrolase [Longimicrobiales bacterium]|nr:alpha/beta hydrolase [Longimicrobiales bacterium]